MEPQSCPEAGATVSCPRGAAAPPCTPPVPQSPVPSRPEPRWHSVSVTGTFGRSCPPLRSSRPWGCAGPCPAQHPQRPAQPHPALRLPTPRALGSPTWTCQASVRPLTPCHRLGLQPEPGREAVVLRGHARPRQADRTPGGHGLRPVPIQLRLRPGRCVRPGSLCPRPRVLLRSC